MLHQAIGNLIIGLGLGSLPFVLVIEGVLLAKEFFFSSMPMIIVVLLLFVPVAPQLGIGRVLMGFLPF